MGILAIENKNLSYSTYKTHVGRYCLWNALLKMHCTLSKYERNIFQIFMIEGYTFQNMVYVQSYIILSIDILFKYIFQSWIYPIPFSDHIYQTNDFLYNFYHLMHNRPIWGLGASFYLSNPPTSFLFFSIIYLYLVIVIVRG